MRKHRARHTTQDITDAKAKVTASEQRATKDLASQQARADSEKALLVMPLRAMRDVNHIAAMIAASLAPDESARGAL